MRKNLLIAVALAVLLLAGAAVAAMILTRDEPAPPVIRGSPTVEFDTTEEPASTAVDTATTEEAEPSAEPWPTYGYDIARTHVSPYGHRPPYRRLWRFRAGAAIEFPPTVAYGNVYVSQIAGHLWALDAETGKEVWHRWFDGHCQAATPTVANGIVYQPLLPKRCNTRGDPGAMIAINARTGKTIWRFNGPPVESTALVVGDTVYFGSWDNNLYALDAKTGKLRWKFTADDEVNTAPVYAHGTVYVGTDGGRVFAVWADSGKLRWQAEAIRREYFYATPAVAYGRVFIANTDGTVYAFGAKTGNLLWTQRVGTYVYTAPAVWDRKVYVGSYDGSVMAIDAATGDVRWRYGAPAALHGGPTVMAGLVYFTKCSNCGFRAVRTVARGERGTFALNARTGKLVWTFPDGKFSPPVADEERVYLMGYSTVYALVACGRGGRPAC
jgi:outer membrane protein assembly factor BamB